MTRVLKYGVVVHTGRGQHQLLPAGSVVPKQYADQVTNPKAYREAEQEVAAKATQPAAPAAQATSTEESATDYSKLKKPELEPLILARGLALGTVAEMKAALAEADKADAAKAESDETDLSTLDEEGLRALAAEKSIDISDATSEEEIRALIENAE
jgi:hypothetical protein